MSDLDKIKWPQYTGNYFTSISYYFYLRRKGWSPISAAINVILNFAESKEDYIKRLNAISKITNND